MMKGGQWRQYTLSSFLGSTPGCLGAFMNVSLYVHGMISFGAIVGGMIATSGDEAFVMLVQFPGTALALFVLLFIAGIIFAWISDKLAIILGIVPCESCQDLRCGDCESDRAYNKPIFDLLRVTTIRKNIQSLSFTRFLLLAFIVGFLFLVITGILGPPPWNWKRTTFGVLSVFVFYIALSVSEHYLHDHIWGHIIKKHIFSRLFMDPWCPAVFTFRFEVLGPQSLYPFPDVLGSVPNRRVDGGNTRIRTASHIRHDVCPGSGAVFHPFHRIVCPRWTRHAPLLSYSLKDSVLIKVFNLAFGLIVGGTLFALGL